MGDDERQQSKYFPKRIREKAVVVLFLFFMFFPLLHTRGFTQKILLSQGVVDLNGDVGGTFYIGNFSEFLEDTGAYTAAPFLGFSGDFYLFRYGGIRLSIASTTVIHPESEPVEGILSYQGFGLFVSLFPLPFQGKIYANIGFQQATMLVEAFNSGYYSFGGLLAVPINSFISLTGGVSFRSGFLHSLIIHKYYDHLQENLEDTPFRSVNVSLGFQYRIGDL